MKTTMLSKFGYCASLIVLIVSIVRWYFIYPDISNMAFGLGFALTILIGAYMHSGFRNLGNEAKEEKKAKDKQIKELNRALDVALDYAREIDERTKGKEY